MNLNPGDRIELGGVEYTVERKLGSGAHSLKLRAAQANCIGLAPNGPSGQIRL